MILLLYLFPFTKKKVARMNFYCGIDLSARDSHVYVIDEELQALGEVKVKNDLARIVKLLERYKPPMKIVVESTFTCVLVS